MLTVNLHIDHIFSGHIQGAFSKKMSQVLQVLEVFEIWISKSSNFSGHQKGSALSEID